MKHAEQPASFLSSQFSCRDLLLQEEVWATWTSQASRERVVSPCAVSSSCVSHIDLHGQNCDRRRTRLAVSFCCISKRSSGPITSSSPRGFYGAQPRPAALSLSPTKNASAIAHPGAHRLLPLLPNGSCAMLPSYKTAASRCQSMLSSSARSLTLCRLRVGEPSQAKPKKLNPAFIGPGTSEGGRRTRSCSAMRSHSPCVAYYICGRSRARRCDGPATDIAQPIFALVKSRTRHLLRLHSTLADIVHQEGHDDTSVFYRTRELSVCRRICAHTHSYRLILCPALQFAR
ncbi:hypothetical protein C8R45DRAFT_305826 [Mycena sanguinolenta]|nr:hypothetical protein C8R45DRAFT_305826 [Mycena sanguinolenta]